MKTSLYIYVFSLTLLFSNCKPQNVNTVDKSEIYQGFNFTGTPYEIKDFASFDSLKNIGTNWISISPFHYMKTETNPTIIDSFPGQWHSESITGIKQQTTAAHNRKIKIMVKPHLWIMDGGFTGQMQFKDKANWLKWESQYTEYIIKYAKVCEQQNTEMLCIGNELASAITQNPNYWNTLIDSIRTIYSGKLTYAANWDNFEKVPFWHKLDLIGINAYFPLSDQKTPSPESTEEGWNKWIPRIKKLKRQTNKPVIFTELGYRATTYCCKEPWEYNNKNTENESCQEQAYKTFFHRIFKKEIEGVFIWKHFDHKDLQSKHDLYSPQNRASWKILKENFEK